LAPPRTIPARSPAPANNALNCADYSVKKIARVNPGACLTFVQRVRLLFTPGVVMAGLAPAAQAGLVAVQQFE
jgi:hypothetical protein